MFKVNVDLNIANSSVTFNYVVNSPDFLDCFSSVPLQIRQFASDHNMAVSLIEDYKVSFSLNRK